MENNNFEVTFPKKDLVEFFLLYSIFVIVNILMFVFNFNFRLSVLLAAHLIPIAIAMVYVTLMFKVEVDENTFKVRTRIGRKYTFNLNDITKIMCTKKLRPRLGPQFSLLIYTKNHEIRLFSEMKGFSQMAVYLLEKLDAQELNNDCVSKSSRKELVKYSEEAYAPN